MGWMIAVIEKIASIGGNICRGRPTEGGRYWWKWKFFFFSIIGDTTCKSNTELLLISTHCKYKHTTQNVLHIWTKVCCARVCGHIKLPGFSHLNETIVVVDKFYCLLSCLCVWKNGIICMYVYIYTRSHLPRTGLGQRYDHPCSDKGRSLSIAVPDRSSSNDRDSILEFAAVYFDRFSFLLAVFFFLPPPFMIRIFSLEHTLLWCCQRDAICYW